MSGAVKALPSRNKDNNRPYVDRRWAATYIFHLGQIQLATKGRDGKIQHYGASKPPGGWGGGVLGISSDGDDQMIKWSQKSRPKKVLRASSKTQKNPWTKN